MSYRSMRELLRDPPPADARRLGGLAWVLLTGRTGAPEIKIWYGRAERPKYFQFASTEQREKWLAGQIVADQKSIDEKAARKVRDRAAADQMAMQIQVGTIFVNSWGWEQTNIDFYQVVRREGRTVWLREICSETVPGSEGFMSDRRRARPGEFVKDAPEIRKVIGRWGVKFEHGGCEITDAKKEHYCSWYA